MTLLDRIEARQKCVVVGCQRSRQRDSLFCPDCLNEMWANRLIRQPDGSYVRSRFTARDLTAA